MIWSNADYFLFIALYEKVTYNKGGLDKMGDMAPKSKGEWKEKVYMRS